MPLRDFSRRAFPNRRRWRVRLRPRAARPTDFRRTLPLVEVHRLLGAVLVAAAHCLPKLALLVSPRAIWTTRPASTRPPPVSQVSVQLSVLAGTNGSGLWKVMFRS